MSTSSSNWETGKAQSTYHFDNFRHELAGYDYRWLGRFEGSWGMDLKRAVEDAEAKTWATRGKQYHADDADLASELNDLERAGMDKDTVIFRKVFDLEEPFQRMVDALALENSKQALHIQFPGEMLNLHIDKQREMNDDPSQVFRFFIFLENWKPGHFVQMGNSFLQWRRGDLIVFDWKNMPHATANAGWKPRSLLQVTGTATEETYKILAGQRPVIDI